jgi:glycosyltransferase involved in cell wall biosynthesis
MISVIIPALNEEDGISFVIKGIPKKIDGEPVETIVVDGGSTDSTVKRAKSANADVRIVVEKRKGKGLAMRTGAKMARGSKIVFIDADGEYDPKYVPYMIRLLPKCDMVKGYRVTRISDVDAETKASILLSKLAMPIYKDFKSKDPLTGLRAFRKRDWKRLNVKSKNFVIETEIEVKAVKNGFKTIEFPIISRERMGSKSKYLRSPNDIVEIYKYIIKNRSAIKNSPKNITTIKEHRY